MFNDPEGLQVGERKREQYSQDAIACFKKNKALGTGVVLKVGTEGIKIQTKLQIPGQKPRNNGGYWTSDRKIVMNWD